MDGQVKAIKAYDLWDVVYPPNPAYIEPNILNKGATLLLGGEAKCGKSFIMLEAVRALSTGTPFMGNPKFQVPKPVRVLYLEAENGEEETVKRFKSIFAMEDIEVWRDNFYFVSKNLDLHFNDPFGRKNAQKLVEDVRPDVVILDPISFFYHADENSNTEVGKLFRTIARFKEILPNMSIVFSHHFGKPPHNKHQREGWDPLSDYNFRGASKWKDGGDTLITMQALPKYRRDPDAWRMKVRFMTRHGSSPEEGTYTFNDKRDLRIEYLSNYEAMLAPIKPKRQVSDAYKHEENLMIQSMFPSYDKETVQERWKRLRM